MKQNMGTQGHKNHKKTWVFSRRLSGLANLKALQRRLTGFLKHCKTSALPAIEGHRAPFGGLESPVSCTAPGSSAGGGDGGQKNVQLQLHLLPL